MYRIGVVGAGFVGGALAKNFREVFPVNIYDKDPSKSTCESMQDLLDRSDIVFICVPTPSREDGSCDTSIVRSVCEEIAAIRKDVMVVIKSTVSPKTSKILAEKTGLLISFNPEFLTEANAHDDFRNQSLIVIGADDVLSANTLYEIYQKFASVVGTKPKMKFASTDEAEMFKYVANCFLATKVIFANEVKKLCDKTEMNYDIIAEIARNDSRLGKTHWAVPGPDGKTGYGGNCLPKDMQALISFADENEVYMEMITLAETLNKEMRD